MATRTTSFSSEDPNVEMADDAWTAGELDEFSNRRFVERLTRYDDRPPLIDPLAAAGPTTPLRPVDDRFQRRLEKRRSRRMFDDRPLAQRDVEQILAATGTDGDGQRVVPSAGGLNSVTTYAICHRTEGAGAGRVVRYNADRHAVNEVAVAPDEATLRMLFNLGDDSMPALLVVFVAHLARLRSKYGVRGDRFALIESGCAAQNIELRLADRGVAGYQLGGVRSEVSELLRITGLPARVTGGIAIGHPSRP